MKDSIICGLDIGSHTIRTLITKSKKGADALAAVGIGEAPSAGVRKGVVVDIEDALEAVRASIQMAEQACGCKARAVYIGVSGTHIASRYSKGVISVSRADQEISAGDVARVIVQAQSIASPPNKEILHTIPKEYIVDGEPGVADPLGMRGLRLEASALIVEGSTPLMKNVTKCIELLGIDADGLVLSPIASSRAALGKRQKELGAVSLDIGGMTSGITVFEEGNIIHTAVLPVGAGHITNDIAIGLQVDVDMAEAIKLEHGVCSPDAVSKKDMIALSSTRNGEKVENISKKEVAHIIEARLDEIFDLANKELKKVSKTAMFPAGVVLTGGGAKMAGIGEVAKKRLRLPAQVSAPQGIEGIVDHIAGPEYATVAGLCLLGFDAMRGNGSSELFPFSGQMSRSSAQWLRKFFKAFLP